MDTDERARQVAHVFVDVFSIATPPGVEEHLDTLADQGVLALGRIFEAGVVQDRDRTGSAGLDATNLVNGALSAMGALLVAAADVAEIPEDQLLAAWREELDR
jgi:hypothetical protein